VATLGDKQVGRLDVAMDDPGAVGDIESIGNFNSDREQQVDV
jgi:hypothetical protein